LPLNWLALEDAGRRRPSSGPVALRVSRLSGGRFADLLYRWQQQPDRRSPAPIRDLVNRDKPGQTRRDILGHESTSMGDRYTLIDDEALDQARRKMDLFQKSRGLMADNSESRIDLLKAEIRRLEEIRAGRETPL
jgi:hypothetical protein